MNQRENTRKLTNTPLTKSGAQGDASPSAPSVGEKLRQETKSITYLKSFKTIENWQKEFHRHPKWVGRSTRAMQKDNVSGALAFYRAFRKFCSAESKGDQAEYQKLLESIFPKKRRDWSSLTTIGDWKKEFERHPEWADRSTKAMQKDNVSGAGSFYFAFQKFCCAESKGDKAEYRRLFRSIFATTKRDWSALTTIEHWRKEFESHPEWEGRNIEVMRKDRESGANAFYWAFRKFCNAQSKGDKATYQKLLESIFPKKQRDWSVLTTIEDWKKEFNSHPEWAGRNTGAMTKDSTSGALAVTS